MTAKIGYIVLTEKEYQHLWDNDKIKMTNVDIAMSHGYPNLYHHIHIHQQATDAINFKITSCILVGLSDKIDSNWRREYLGHRLYLIAITSQWMSQGRGTSYVHTVETAVNIKSLNSTSRSRHLHFMCHPSATSW